MRRIRLAILLASTLFAALLLAPPASAVTPVTFSGPTNFAVGDGPNSVAVGDFNGDGDPDLLVANEFAASVSVLLGGTAGSFSAATNIVTGGYPFAVAVGDFNGRCQVVCLRREVLLVRVEVRDLCLLPVAAGGWS